ncbi:uncharacterized protein I303_104421 [Kwoniella dejecticola CBS 10117]|uniref:Ras guanyl-nucleotide exchange factor n=1 Tax=Kwoniella dejecticola CBS 10117 TaxID=1296121 RepID=A0A1A6A5D2_9TREE|nr:uncharacterized protein I303_04600 [Kwoniella dejecticola CBS 10117]OBR85267.1 hypothetical protein I303_04600 [Kwoniella dejecticola CBS 10117]
MSASSSRANSSNRLATSSSNDSMTPSPSSLNTPTNPDQTSLLQSARLKLSTMDQEAMNKMRSTMMDYPESTSSKSSPASARFPPESIDGRRELRTRRSTLSRQVQLNEHDESSRSGPDLGANPEPHQSGPSRPPSADTDYVIAVIGHEGVGKTTVIARALRTWGMSHPVRTRTSGGHTIQSCYSQIQPGGKLKQPWKVEFLEMNMHALNLSPSASSVWLEGVPDVSGVIFCYDATRSDTLSGISEALDRLSPLGLPIVILACKTDPEVQLEVDAHTGNSIGEPFNVGLIEVTTQTSEGKSKMRNALRWLIYKLEQRQRRHQRRLNTNPNANTSLIIPSNPPASPGLASATLEALSSPIDSDASSSENRIMWHRRNGFNMTPADQDQDGDEISDNRSSGSSLNWVMKGPPPRTSLDMGKVSDQQKVIGQEKVEEDKEATAKGNGIAQPKERVVTQTGIPIDPPVWLTSEELLNKLFAAIVSSQDERFVRAFGMTYRRFMQPGELIQHFLMRLKAVETYDVTRDVKNWTMMKMTGALVDWTSRYPGDLHEAEVQDTFKAILAFVLHHTFMAHLTGELIMVEHSLPEVRDLDQSWSVKPTSSSSRESIKSQQASSTTNTELVIDTEVLYEFSDPSIGGEKGIILEDEPPDTPFSKEHNTHSARSVSTSSLPVELLKSDHRDHSDERISSADEMGFHKWAQAYNLVSNMDARTFAVELTKLQWKLFAAIRPRDVLRHDLGKETSGPVGKAILFFNHISRWVSTIILAHPKPKHRARMIEKFIVIAHQLRRLNNYDSLYAVISGLRETSVHRLSITQQLVTISPNLEKDYQSHLKLMDPRGGYVHYRRALQADISNGRASIPLLNNILGLINRLQNVRKEDKRVGEGDRMEIQWDKFLKFGEILNVINDCQIRGPIVRGEVNEGFRKIVEDTVIISNEDGLWERSQLLEPSGGGTVGGKVLKRLVNLGFS